MPCHFYFVFVPYFVLLLLNVAQSCQKHNQKHQQQLTWKEQQLVWKEQQLVWKKQQLVWKEQQLVWNGTTLQFSSISAMPWHLCFMFVHIFCFVVACTKTNNKRNRPLSRLVCFMNSQGGRTVSSVRWWVVWTRLSIPLHQCDKSTKTNWQDQRNLRFGMPRSGADSDWLFGGFATAMIHVHCRCSPAGV